MTTEGTAVSDAHVVACARNLLEVSRSLLNESGDASVSKDAMDSVNHDMHLAFALLARRYNSQHPVNRLHPELLGMVFEHLRAPAQAVDPEEPLEIPVFDAYVPLIHATMVCHKWYTVASNKASLWTDVDYSRGRGGPTFLLERSRMAPVHLRLNVNAGGSAEDSAYYRGVVHMNAFRLRQLDVWTKDVNGIRITVQLLENDMPLLQCLRMSHEYYRPKAILRNTQGRFPSLRGLMLKGHVWLPEGGAGPLMKLTHLHVSDVSNIPVAGIMMLLDATPALEVLELYRCHSVALTELPSRTTTLQRLTHLTIRQMYTEVAEVFMPALFLPSATTVCLWLDINTPRLTDAVLPQPTFWHDATRIYIGDEDEGSVYETLSIELEAATHRLALRLYYEELDDRTLWPLPVPTFPIQFAQVSSVHLCLHDWTVLQQFVARVPALATLVLDLRGEGATLAMARRMVEEVPDVLLQDDPVLCPGLRELALVSSKAMSGLTELLAPALRKRQRDGRQVERLRTWIEDEPEDGWNIAELTITRDIGDALAEYVGAGEVEHEEGAFWPRDEEVWRRENEFWAVSRTWRSHYEGW